MKKVIPHFGRVFWYLFRITKLVIHKILEIGKVHYHSNSQIFKKILVLLFSKDTLYYLKVNTFLMF